MTFLLAHLSDAHLGPLPPVNLRDLIGKPLTGYINWTRGRGRAHDMRVLAALSADALAQAPDHIAVTGDLLNLGLPDEIPGALRFLESLGDPNNVSFVPGNHDAYVRRSMSQLAQRFSAWTGDEAQPESKYPYLRKRGNIALIGLSSAIPTAPFLASGRLGNEQRRRFAIVLQETRAKNLARVVMIHHPPHRAGASAARGLDDARAFEALIAEHGAELIVHGHNHRLSCAHLRGPDGPVPVVGVASASAAGGTRTHRAGYNLFRIDASNGRVRIEGWTRGLMDDRTTIGDLGAIAL